MIECKCKSTLSRILGDGCEVCNKDMALDVANERIAELEKVNRMLIARLSDEPNERNIELEQQLAELREAVDEVLNASVSSLEYRSNRLQLAVWDLGGVRDKALLQESGDE